MLLGHSGDNKAMTDTPAQRQLRALVEAGMILVSELDLDALLQRIADLSREVIGARYGAVGVLGDSGELVRFVGAPVFHRLSERAPRDLIIGGDRAGDRNRPGPNTRRPLERPAAGEATLRRARWALANGRLSSLGGRDSSPRCPPGRAPRRRRP